MRPNLWVIESSFGRLRTIECSVWSNGGSGWGLKILGGLAVRRKYFRRSLSPILVEVDGNIQEMNVDKDSFWVPRCGELIHRSLRESKNRHLLERGDRVSLGIIEPFRRFTLKP